MAIKFLSEEELESGGVWEELQLTLLLQYQIRSNLSDTHPDSGESWQYMGTVTSTPKGDSIHQFRHRQHPANGMRMYVDVLGNGGSPC
jgi:hypothetical protein